MDEKQKEKLLAKSQVLDRGWTDTLVKKFLPDPDEIKPNPIYKSAAPMKLYKLERVEVVETTDQFKKEMLKTVARKKVAQKVVQKKSNETMEYVDKFHIKVKKLSDSYLIKCACDSYNDWHWEKGNDFEQASKDSDPLFLERICVNYLRHEMSHYEQYLDQIFGKVGKFEAYNLIRSRIFAEIARLYPWLAGECQRQDGE